MVELKVTGFGYTWLDGDYPIELVVGCSIFVLLAPMLLIRAYGAYNGMREPREAIKAL